MIHTSLTSVVIRNYQPPLLPLSLQSFPFSKLLLILTSSHLIHITVVSSRHQGKKTEKKHHLDGVRSEHFGVSQFQWSPGGAANHDLLTPDGS